MTREGGTTGDDVWFLQLCVAQEPGVVGSTFDGVWGAR